MSFKFELIESETDRENLLDGDYVAVIRKVEEKMDKYGTYVLVEEELLSPIEVKGRREFERFYTGAYDEEKQKWGKIFFTRMCRQLLDISGSLVTDCDVLIGKTFIKTVKNNVGKNGKAFQNTTNRILIKDNATLSPEEKAIIELQYGKTAVPAAEPHTQVWPIDDEVPF